MSSLNRFIRVCAIALSMLTITSNALAAKLLSDVTLDWKPTAAINAKDIDTNYSHGKKIQLGTFTDNRNNKNLIAENREEADEGKILPVTTTTDIPAWIAIHLANEFQQIGLTTVTSDADFVLDAAVEKFFVLETDRYRANVSLHLRLTDKTGNVVWDTTLTANEARAGRSYKLDNYAQVLSDGVQNLARAIVSSPDFQAALTAAK